jgi:hypothetical protein
MNYLLGMGFEFNSEGSFYYGEQKGYYITIEAETSLNTGDAITINASVRPTQSQNEIMDELRKNYELSVVDGHYWVTNRIGFLFTPPNQNELKQELNQLIDDIRFKNIIATPIN